MYHRPVTDEFIDDPVEHFASELVRFNSLFIRLGGPAEIGFSALSIVHTLFERGPSHLVDLQATERIKQSALSSAVAQLERDGLVERSADPRDRRARMIRLTDLGEQLVRSRHDERVRRLRMLVERSTVDEKTSLADAAHLLERLLATTGPSKVGRTDGEADG